MPDLTAVTTPEQQRAVARALTESAREWFIAHPRENVSYLDPLAYAGMQQANPRGRPQRVSTGRLTLDVERVTPEALAYSLERLCRDIDNVWESQGSYYSVTWPQAYVHREAYVFELWLLAEYVQHRPEVQGVGRISREAYRMQIGDEQFEVDELRTYTTIENEVIPALCLLDPPLTRAEGDWLLEHFRGVHTWQRLRLAVAMLTKPLDHFLQVLDIRL